VKSERRSALKGADGRHTRAEITAIHQLQMGRCIYCNVIFSAEQPPTRDHILPVAYGGADWAINIVLACRSCNSRRCHVPFRTFCRLLSPKQNERIFEHIVRRILAIDHETVTEKEFENLDIGLRLHVKSEWRYKMMSKMKKFRANAKINKLLPLGVAGFQRKKILRLRAEVRKAKGSA
jgi:hypothetical protein